MTNMNSKLDEILTVDTSVDEDITFSVSDITISSIDTSNIDTITIDTASTISLDTTHWADGITWQQTEFEDTMPNLSKVENMCKEYPALDKAYENFRTVYAMVHQDWIGKSKDEELPF